MLTIFFIATVVIDQLTKLLAVANLKNKSDLILIKNWLHLSYVENSGAAWGIFSNGTLILSIVTIGICFAILYYLIREYNNIDNFLKLTLVMILAGAIGNLIDRIRLGYVIDFIFTPLGGLYNFPVFNFADIYVVLGAIFIIIHTLFIEGKNVR